MSQTDQQIFETLAQFFEPDTDIVGAGLVDSMAIFRLITFVEEAFAITISPDEVVLENFQTLRAVRNLIVKKLG